MTKVRGCRSASAGQMAVAAFGVMLSSSIARAEGPGSARLATGTGVIVLDFSGGDHVGTAHPAVSGVQFDMDGNGTLERCGWITGGASFLVADLNVNGRIDSGRELFGTASPAVNDVKGSGYEILKRLDANGDGMLDRSDLAWGRLSLWRDANMNGVTDPTELTSLAMSGVTRIAVGSVAEPALPAIGPDAVMNRVVARSRFWGPPACGTEGCGTFAVTFGTMSADDNLRMVRSGR